LSLLILAWLSLRLCRADRRQAHLSYRSPFSRLSMLALGGTFLLFVSGAVVAGSRSAQACSSWPLCNGFALPSQPAEWINFSHRLVVLLVGVLMGVLLLRAWRTQRTQTAVLVATTAAVALFFAQALMGAKLVAGFPAYLLGLHEATAVSVWVALAVQAAAVGMAGRTTEDEHLEAGQITAGPARPKISMLTKPVVVLLLLVTTFADGDRARAWPSLPVAF
jgi:heme A synthase